MNKLQEKPLAYSRLNLVEIIIPVGGHAVNISYVRLSKCFYFLEPTPQATEISQRCYKKVNKHCIIFQLQWENNLLFI